MLLGVFRNSLAIRVGGFEHPGVGIALPILLFVAGFCVGAFVIWAIKNRELEAREKTGAELDAAFGNLSKQAPQTEGGLGVIQQIANPYPLVQGPRQSVAR